MIFFRTILAFAALAYPALISYGQEASTNRIDLTGRWQVRLDPQDVGERESWFSRDGGQAAKLPGTVSEAGLGKALQMPVELNTTTLKRLRQRRRYQGAAFFHRDFDLPESWESTFAELTLERVIWKSKVWINGQLVGEANSLSTAHRYRVEPYLNPGRNSICVLVDNRDQVELGTNSHAFTEETQSIWNGIVGDISIRGRPEIAIEDVQVLPQLNNNIARCKFVVFNSTDETVRVPFEIKAIDVEGRRSSQKDEIELRPGRNQFYQTLPIRSPMFWSEHHPNLYNVSCKIGSDAHTSRTGFRNLKARDGDFWLNGDRIFLRGTLDCCIFPRTGYPPTSLADWREQLQAIQSFGFNHVRYHSWCPPEAAFQAADELGVYFQVELPNWRANIGQRDSADEFLKSEAERIINAYAQHPSFLLMSLGNELKGDFGWMDEMVGQLRKSAPHILMTSTSFSFSQRGRKPGPVDQFFVTQETTDGWIRGQWKLNSELPGTMSDYTDSMKRFSIPVVSHEIGQYASYPLVEDVHKYQGNLRAVALEAIQNDLEAKGRLADARPYAKNSTALGFELYKEEIERALRTEKMDGYQVLNLQDFPGQSTATVGLVNAFLECKDGVDPDRFREFCSPVVPLVQLPKRTWSQDETLTADWLISNFGAGDIENETLTVTLLDGDHQLMAARFSTDVPQGSLGSVGSIEFPLAAIKSPRRLTLKAVINGTGYANRWSVWVYPKVATNVGTVKVFNELDAAMIQVLEDGGDVLFLPDPDSMTDPIAGQFVPVFWSPVHFPKQPGTMGCMIDDEHPLFKNFPTNSHSDWQWWKMLRACQGFDLDEISVEQPRPIMQLIDKFDRNTRPTLIWETKIGLGRLLVCTLDIESNPDQRIAPAALKRSILDYMNSDEFRPNTRVSSEQLMRVFRSSSETDDQRRGD
ncbi:MAG: sugar-binding domain-containing protein [Planctomycetota bacterium]